MRAILGLKGVTGLVMHNDRLADPFDVYTKAIKAITDKKRNMTDTDLEEKCRLEWHGGIYHATDIGVYVPTWNVVRCLEEAAKITRNGKNIIRSVIPLIDRVPLDYQGARGMDELYESPEFRFRKMVGVGTSRVLRMRPVFRRWAIELEVELLEDVLNLSDLVQIGETAGRAEGLCDARKLGMGKFSFQVVS